MPCSIAWSTTPIGSNSPARACASAKRLSRSLDLPAPSMMIHLRPARRRRPAAFRSEWWPASRRNSGRLEIGIPGRLRRNTHPAVVVFGRDEAGKAHASWFDHGEAALAEKAAGLMGLRVLRV